MHTLYNKKNKKTNLDDININDNNNINVFGYRSSEWFKGAILMAFSGGFISTINNTIAWIFGVLSFICWCCMSISFLKAIEKIANRHDQD